MPAPAQPSGRPASRGVALIIVLWMVAALTIAVSGLVYSARGEIRSAATLRDTVAATARGDAAIRLVLQELAAAPQPVQALTVAPVSFDGLTIPVRVVPVLGLVDLNRAAEPLLTDLLAVGGGLDRAAAGLLARAIIERRRSGAQRLDERPGMRTGPFEAREDLLQVHTVDYELYAKLAPLVTVDASGSGRVNPHAAPLEVLTVLAGGDVGLARQIAAERESRGLLADTTRLPATHVDQGTSRRYRVEAHVPLPDGATLVRSHTVQAEPIREEGLPWRVFHAERRIQPAGLINN